MRAPVHSCVKVRHPILPVEIERSDGTRSALRSPHSEESMAEVPVAGSGFLADVKAGDQRLRLLATETGYGVAANIYSLTPSTSRCLETATTGTGRACSKGVSMAMIPPAARLSQLFGHHYIRVGPTPL